MSKLTLKIDQAAARSAKLKADLNDLLAELAALAKAQANMDDIRAETHADDIQAKADLEQGWAGVRKALVVLRTYYAKDAAEMVDVGSLMQPPAKPELFAKAGADPLWGARLVPRHPGLMCTVSGISDQTN